MFGWSVGFTRGEHGQSIVELAMVLPMMAFTVLGGADLARSYAHQLAVQNGARAGAEAAAIDSDPTEVEIKAQATAEMNRTPGMNAADATINVTLAQSDGTACIDPPTPVFPCYVTVRVRYTDHTTVNWPMIPNTVNFDRTTTMRTIKGGTLPP